jgi:hypothetical protein
MAILPAVPNVLKVAIKGLYQGQPWMNGHYLQYTGTAPTVANLATIAAAIGSAWTANLAALCEPEVTVTEIDTTDLTSAFASQAATSQSLIGTRAGDPLPVNIACVVSWQANFRFRGGHARTYLPAGAQTDITSGRLWASGFVSAANTAVAAYLAALNAISVGGATYKMVMVSYREANVDRTVPLVVTINSGSVHGRLDTQRRRLGKETP